MKSIVRSISTNVIALYLTSLILLGFVIQKDVFTLLIAATVLTLLNKLIRPIIKLLLLPINLITLGLFSWAVAVITIFILTVIVDGVSISAFTFPGISFQGFIVPSMEINLPISYIISSFMIYAITSITRWIYKS
jgi:putative membrane protein